MRDNKAFASLTSGLLARKGQARPAMRPQGGFGLHMSSHDDLGWNDMGHDVPRPEGVRLPASLSGAPAIVPVRVERAPVVRQQQDDLAEAMARPVAETPVVETPVAATPVVIAPVAATVAPPAPAKPTPAKSAARKAKAATTQAPRAPRESARKAAFTLRLEPERHLRLRLACAVEHRSAQQIVTAALDQFLASLPDIERLATSLPPKRGGKD